MSNYVIIGASSGIGKTLADSLQSQGHTIIGTYNKNQITNPNILAMPLDIMRDPIDLDIGWDAIDGLVYCPGSINLKPFARIKEMDYINDFRLHVTGAIKVIQNLLPKLKKSASASIVLFSTVAVDTGFNFHTQVSVSKGAVQGLVKSLAAELAPKVRVNCIAPSLTQTTLAGKILSTAEKIEANAQRHPLKRIGQPEDIAHMAAFLLSEKSSWITGQIIGVDGGISSLKV